MTQESSTEQQQLTQQLSEIGAQVSSVASDVAEIKNNGNLLRQNLLGGVEAEAPHGRVPALENRTGNHETRLQVLEGAHIRYKAYGVVVGFLSGIISAVITSAIILLIQKILQETHR